MAKTCPSCGNQALDNEALFCNKCGYRIPEAPPRRTIIANPAGSRPADPPAHSPPVIRRAAGPDRKKPEREGGSLKKFLQFNSFITDRHMPLLYIIGALTITLVSLISITGGTALPFTNTTVSATTPQNTPSPVLWIGILILGNIVWRIACEVFVVLFRIHDSLAPSEQGLVPEEVGGSSGEDLDSQEDTATEYVECPHCSSTVLRDQIRECESCGVVGCERCIRLTGLIRKKMICKACFENK
jgi:hypothetical protein